ncbi:MAG: diguanylate cyclase [Coriobacteriia bacterium]|nr:diguanylate cyclase [Coriobacteriia bacterium]
MFSLDMRTMLLNYIVLAMLCTGVIGVLWSKNRDRVPGIGLWLADYAAQVVGLLLISLRGAIPDFISMVVGNVLISAGTIWLLAGLERYLGKPSRQTFNYAFLALFTAVHSYYAVIRPDLTARNINASVALAFLTAQVAWLMLRRAHAGIHSATAGVGWVMAAYTAIATMRIAHDLAERTATDLFQSATFDTAVILSYQVLFVALTASLLIMVNDHLFAAAEKDAAELRKSEAALRLSEQRFAAAFHNLPDGIVLTRASDGLIAEANEGFLALASRDREAAVGHTTIELGFWADSSKRLQYLAELEQCGAVREFEAEFNGSEGREFPGVVSGEMIDISGEPYILSVVRDVTEHRLAQERLVELSTRDSLTGLLNRRAFREAARKRLADAGDAHVTAVYFDMDDLKGINDRFGHEIGDRAIVVVADAVRSAFRESDITARVGGDEFAVLSFSRGERADEAVAARFEAELSQRNRAAGLPFEASAALGTASREPGAAFVDLDTLLREADARMYDAKRNRGA